MVDGGLAFVYGITAVAPIGFKSKLSAPPAMDTICDFRHDTMDSIEAVGPWKLRQSS